MTIPPKPVGQISFQFNECQLYCFDFNSLKITNDKKCGQDFVSGYYPVEKCEGIAGPFIKDYAKDIKPKAIFNIEQCNAKD